jgi:chromosome segregation ATPase
MFALVLVPVPIIAPAVALVLVLVLALVRRYEGKLARVERELGRAQSELGRAQSELGKCRRQLEVCRSDVAEFNPCSVRRRVAAYDSELRRTQQQVRALQVEVAERREDRRLDLEYLALENERLRGPRSKQV